MYIMRGSILSLSTMQFHDRTGETLQTIRASILGSVALLPLLVLPTMVGALVDHAGFTEAEAGWVASVGFAGSALGAIIAGLRIRHFDPRLLAVIGLLTKQQQQNCCAAGEHHRGCDTQQRGH